MYFPPPFLTSISLSSSITPSGGRTLRKPRWTWTCSCAGLTRSSSGWSQRCVCALSSASACSSSRNSSRLPPSKQTSSHRCVLSCPQLCLSEFLRVRCSCKEYRNLNGFFAVTMGLSNPAVCRLNLTWEVRRGSAAPIDSSLIFSSTFTFLSTETSQQVQEVLQGVWELDGKLEQLALRFRMPLSCFLNWNSVLCGGHVRLPVSVTVSTGPVQEPPSVPADRSQTGSSHHSFHASAD